MTKTGKILTTLLLAMLPRLCLAADGQLTVKATNKLQVARLHQTIELSASQLAPLGEKDLNKIHVKDGGGKEVLCQAVDTDFDAYHTPDIVIFQAGFGPGGNEDVHGIDGRQAGVHEGPVQGLRTFRA